MRTFSRFLSVLTLLALMSAPVLRAQDDQTYDPQADDQAVQSNPQYDQQSAPQYDQQPAPQYDQQPENPPAQANPQYDAENSAPANTPDPPARAARLQYMNGSVSVQPQGTGDWVTGEQNRPLTNSDNIWADKNSRAEISVGTGLIRIDSETSLTLTSIAENAVQLQLHQGAMYLHVRRLYDGETYEIDTPNQAFTVQKPGDYRFDVDSDGDKTVITVWRGEGESTGSGPSVRIRANQQARFTNGTSMTNDIHGAPAPDAFDEWAQSRDSRMDHSASARYVSPDVVGYEDLDEYGNWKETPDYGALWVPSVAPGWSPYYNGNWIWEEPWGWTWVEAEPWGYAPFHYGRWVWGGGYWGWAPGPIWVRPYYAPALVAWFGGPGWGVNFGFGFGGGFGWCPLGFGEPFIPWYGVSRGYFNNVNITNTRITNVTNINNIYNNNYLHNHPGTPGNPGKPGSGPYGPHSGSQLHYANLRAPNGFTAASRNTLVNSLPVARNSVRVSPNQLSRTSLAAVRSPEVRPTRTTMLGVNAGHPAATPSRNFARPVVSHMTSPATNRNGMAGVRNTPAMGRGNTGLPQMGANRGISNPGNGARNSNGGTRMRGGVPSPANPASMRSPNAVGSRSIPRPPNAGGMTGRSSGAVGTRSGIGPVNGPGSNVRPTGPQSARSMSPQMRPQSVPRPSAAGMSRGGGQMSTPRGATPGNSRGSASTPRSNGPRSEMSVPRPPNSSAPSGFSSANRGSFPGAGNSRSVGSRPAPSYQANNRPAPNYGGSYSRPSPSYAGGSYSRPTPSYNRGSSMPSYGRSMPSYGGGGGNYGRSMPSYGGGRSAAPSYGGGRAPSYSAGRSGGGFGGGGRSSGGFGGGGGHASGGGGGRASGGGGGHASSGGGGGHSSGGGSHGGRH